ncbi:hypothetical protein HPB50_019407 [Hyalomma asiaticum]|uniref:Uncharacterized protein n=1 Tax=Hyalomma asiaticum TaxID=266040 RepID=A0ACB7RN16_HYAAI|nr:hypothetical protein HPB50_019407 [Hyalomma asiaticum]
MPAGVENPADYYKNVAFSPTSVNGDGTKPTGDACQGTGKVASEKTGKRASDGDKAFVESKKPRLEDSSELEDVKVPREVQLFQFLGSRADEIASLVKDVERKYPKLISQQVPRHMRRRTPDPPKSKRPSRKHRRRPRNLLAEYARRQRRHVWLETHIWHAKRFKMADLWGYRVPLYPTDKGIRAAYRGSAKHVLLHRVSAAIAARGKHDLRSGVESNLVRRAAPSAPLSCTAAVAAAGAESTASASLGATDSVVVTLSDRAPKPAVVSVATLPSRFAELVSGLTFGAKSYLPGTREGTVVLYRRNCYPFGAIGPAKFLWRAAADQKDSDESKNDRQLWLWVHPAIHNEVTEELVSLFELQRVQARPVSGATAEAKMRNSDISDECEGVQTSSERTSTSNSKRVKFEDPTCNVKAETTGSLAGKETAEPAQLTVQSTVSADETKCKTGAQMSGICKAQKQMPTKVAVGKTEPEEDKAPMVAEVLQLPVYTNGTVTMVQLKEQMVRFSLTGPLATEVILNALTPSLEASSPKTEAWWNVRTEEKQAQESGWELVQREDTECETALLPRVLGRTVRDPRILLPACKIKWWQCNSSRMTCALSTIGTRPVTMTVDERVNNVPTALEALDAVDVLRRYFGAQEGGEDGLNIAAAAERAIVRIRKMHQCPISFFAAMSV